MSIEALEKAIEIVGSQSGLARAMGHPIRQCHIHNWLKRNKKVPASQVLRLEEVTGIPRHEFRPDIYPRESAQT